MAGEVSLNWASDKPLIDAHGWQHESGLHVTKAVWCNGAFAFALGDGKVQFADQNGMKQAFKVHDNAILAAAPLDGAIVTCSDDGKVASTTPEGKITHLIDAPGRFFDQLATASWGGVAVADGRRIYIRLPDGSMREYKATGSVGGLAFSPKGRKLAASRNNGVSVYWVGTEREAPDTYEWQGAHGPVTWNARGDFIVTAMHENALHVWRTDNEKHGRMGGYPSRIKSLSWDQNGINLATSGADGVVIWPFSSKSGPIGQGAEQIPLKTDEIVATLAWHPSRNVIAVGTDHANLLLVRRDGAILPLARDLESVVTTLEWAEKGSALAFGCDSGRFGLIDFSNLVYCASRT